MVPLFKSGVNGTTESDRGRVYSRCELDLNIHNFDAML